MASNSAEDIQYRKALIDEIYELRFAVLRPKLVPMKLHFPGDGDQPPKTWHFGAFTTNGKNVGCLTLFASEWEGKPAIQLRGMAVLPEFRGMDVGRRLLRAAKEAVAQDPVAGASGWWCNARTESIGFYEKNGWRIVSEEFMIESVGPHKKMVW